MIERINQNFNEIEAGFNVAGGIPLVCIFTGATRAHLGVVQKVVGIFMTVVGGLGHVVSEKEDDRWLTLLKLGLEHLIQGALNIIRGVAETLMGVYTFGIGNLILLAIQYGNKDGFAPIVKYGFISEERRMSLV